MKEKKDNKEKKENKEDVKTKQSTQSDIRENIKELGVVEVPETEDDIVTLSIIGQIEGHNENNQGAKSTKYEHIIPELVSIERSTKVKGVLVILNTIGGDVEAGLAISEMITSISKPTVSLVIGGGHSIGVPLATSADYSFISPSATMIVHPIRMHGLVIGARQTFEYFNKMQERIFEFITRTSNIKKERLMEMMTKTDELMNDTGTILIGEEAVKEGIINETGGIKEAIAKLDELINKKNES